MNNIWIKNWYEKKNKNNVLVFSKEEFRDIVEFIKDKDDVAIISVEATPECAKYWLVEEKDDSDNRHLITSSNRVLNVNFDDLNEDREYKGHLFKAISKEQAKEIVDFIELNLGKQFIIHCKAGKSRSQGIARFILDTYPDYYEECLENKYNPCLYPNITVLTSLKRAYREKWFEDCGPSSHPWLDFDRQLERLIRQYKEHGSLVVGYDFDGTIYDTNGIGGDFSPVIDLLRKCTEIGFRMCLWTAEPKPEQLEWKIEYAKKLGIGVDYVNESPLMPGTKKPYFNILLDDRAGLPYTYRLLTRALEILNNV